MENRTGLSKLIDWYDSLDALDQARMDYKQTATDRFMGKALELLAAEKAQKPMAEGGLIEELYKYIDKWRDIFNKVPRTFIVETREEHINDICEILSKYQPAAKESAEPLEELCKKHKWILEVWPKGFRGLTVWHIYLKNPSRDMQEFVGDTYQEAEAAARKYLEGLPDKEER
jgi:hypothetical protein